MFTDRRSFLRTSMILGAAAAAGLPASPQAKRVIPQQGHDLIEQMKWRNDPASFKQNGEELIVHSKPKTDFWRKTYYGYITDNGHFFIFRSPAISSLKLTSTASTQHFTIKLV